MTITEKGAIVTIDIKCSRWSSRELALHLRICAGEHSDVWISSDIDRAASEILGFASARSLSELAGRPLLVLSKNEKTEALSFDDGNTWINRYPIFSTKEGTDIPDSVAEALLEDIFQVPYTEASHRGLVNAFDASGAKSQDEFRDWVKRQGGSGRVKAIAFVW